MTMTARQGRRTAHPATNPMPSLTDQELPALKANELRGTGVRFVMDRTPVALSNSPCGRLERNSPKVELTAGVLQRATGGADALEPGLQIGGGFRRAAFDLLGKLDCVAALGLGLLD